MAHGQPDYGPQAVKETVFGQADMGELAVRLGSIDSYDRGGDVVFLDSFESGLGPYQTFTSGLGAEVVISPEHARNGMFSLKLTAGSTLGEWASFHKWLPFPRLSSVGVEFSFILDADSLDFEFLLTLHNGTIGITTGIKYLIAARTVQYWSDLGAWADLAVGINLYTDNPVFHTLKVVVDWSTEYYKRLLIDNEEWDMSHIPVRTSLSPTYPVMRVIVYNDSVGAINPTMYVDDLIVTQNEP